MRRVLDLPQVALSRGAGEREHLVFTEAPRAAVRHNSPHTACGRTKSRTRHLGVLAPLQALRQQGTDVQICS